MLPDLTGFSQEEAALITDVLSQLSIESSAATSTVPHSTLAHAALQDQTLTELDLAVWTIEQELRSMQETHAQGTQREHAQHDMHEKLASQDSDVRSASLNSTKGTCERLTGDGVLGCPSPTSRTAHDHGQIEMLSRGEAPTDMGQDEGTAQEASQTLRFGVSNYGSQGEANGLNQAGSQLIRPHQQQPVSLLKEMRKKLRQQQTQQRTSDGPPDAVSNHVTSVDSSTPSVVGLRGPVPGPSGSTIQSEALSVGGGSPSSLASAWTRRPAPYTPASVGRAFTMLNARTSVDRYGPEPGFTDVKSLTPTKQPVKLPEAERSARLQQLYERTSKWRQRCEERYAKERREKTTSELEDCTFSPKISTASHLITQGKSPSEAYLEISKSITPTKHQRSSIATPTSGRPSRETPTQSAGPAGSKPGGAAKAVTSKSAESSNGGNADGSPPMRSVNGSEVGERLYQRALNIRARQEARFFKQLLEEEQQRRFTASVQHVSPRVFDAPAPPTSRYLPSGLEECTFHPRTSVSNHRPKSAPHMRSVAGRPASLTSPLYDIYGPPDMASSGDVLGYSRTASFTPNLDWDEFLARQERFVAMREQKLALMDQNGPAVSHICPGSKKLLRERALRQSFQALKEHVPDNVPESIPEAEPLIQQDELSRSGLGSTSPTPEERRAKVIMDMYKECTFQPQITRKAAALPGRQIEDFVEGGRARREEWRQQQQTQKEMREAAELTFKPQIITKDAYPHVRPRITLKNVDAYLAHVADRRKQRDALSAELDSERDALEMQQCTFKPQTTPLPAYLIRRLQEQHLQGLQVEQVAYSVASSGGLGEVNGENWTGSGAGRDEPPPEFRHSSQVAHGGDPVADAQGPPIDAYRDAYERALAWSGI